jgi:N-acetylglucosaminyl-diphospho-decaprenol L-rhamnosyltransferase
MSDSLLTISIVSHGHGRLLGPLLADLARCMTCELVLTINVAEDEDFLNTVRPAGLTVIRNAAPKGFGANHNAAFARCRTPWFAVLNPDIRLSVDPFPVLLSAIAPHPEVGVIAPRIVNAAGQDEDSVRANPAPWSVAGRVFDRRIGRARGTQGFFWLAGMFLLFRSQAFERVGGFDERFFLYYEDYDICARLWRAGFPAMWEPRATAIHEAQRDSRRSIRHLRWHVGSLARVWTSGVFWWAAFRGRQTEGAK